MTEPNEDKMLARIRALLAKAESTQFPEEAEAYTAKAMELIARHSVDEALLTAADPTRDTVGDRIIDIPNPYAYPKAVLLNSIVRAMGGRCILIPAPDGGRRMHLFGYGSDLDRIELLYTSLLVQSANEMTHLLVPHNEGIKAFKRAFLLGFAQAVEERLTAAERRAAQEAEANRTSGPSTALVLVERKQAVSRLYDQKYPRTRTNRVRTASSGSGAGYRAGQRADLGGTRVGGRAMGAIGR